MRFIRRLPKGLLSLLALLLLGACGSDAGKKSEAKAPARILAFTADPSTVREGEATTLSWETRDALSLVIFENDRDRMAEDLPTEGNVRVEPLRSTRYRLEALGEDGEIASAEVEVQVESAGRPRIETFSASSKMVQRGQTLTLSWRVIGADSLEIVSERDGRLAWIEPAPEEGSFEARPMDSTKYGLRARNAAGVVTASVEVEVGKRPSVTLWLSAEEATYGEELTLSWTVADADSLTIQDPRGETIHEGPAQNGSMSVRAFEGGLFRALAKGPGGEDAAEVPLEVRPKIESFEVLLYGDPRPGAIGLARWRVRGAERIVISSVDYDLLESEQGEGATSVLVGTATAFNLRAHAGRMIVERKVQLRLVETPLIRRLATGQMVTAGQGVVGMSTVGWEVDGATALELEVDPGGPVDISGKSLVQDEIDLIFQGPGTVTLTAFNDAGASKMEIPSPVDPVPTIEEFFAAPSRVGLGETVELHWRTRDAQLVLLEREGAELAVDPEMVNGQHPVPSPLTATTSFVLRVRNGLGHEVASDPVVVETGPPNQISFDTQDGLRVHQVGSVVHLLWENDGGTTLGVTNALTGEEICATASAVDIRQGGCPLTLPGEQQELSLLLEVRNGSGVDSRTLDLMVVEGALITRFTTEVDEITEGDSLLFLWEILPDVEGNAPSLDLRDDRGERYDLSDVAGEAALQGARSFRVFGWSDEPRAFTLTATSASPPASTAHTEVKVHGLPRVEELVADPPFAQEMGDEVQIHATILHATSIKLYRLAESGLTAGTPFFDSSTAKDASKCSFSDAKTLHCNTSFVPTLAQPHVRLVAQNPLGASTAADLRIGVSPASVTSFTANGISAPATIDLLEGEELVLAWETARATTALLQEEWVDISQRASAIELPFSGSDAVTNLIHSFEFPEGFSFPYDGGIFDWARACISGWLSFDHAALGTGLNVLLPSATPSAQKIHLLPFWDGLIMLPPQSGDPPATLWMEYIEGEPGQLILQWTGMNLSFIPARGSELNFQLVLFDDGNFEYRYGPMRGMLDNVKGSSATIAAQNRAGDQATVISHEAAVPAGLEGKVFRFAAWDDYLEDASTPLVTPLQGSIRFIPRLSRTYALEAANAHSSETVELRVNVHSPARLRTWVTPEAPQPGDGVVLHWEGENLSVLEIEDTIGNLVHAVDPSQLESGSFFLGSLGQGDHSFVFRGLGQVISDRLDREVDILVYEPFSIDSFGASPSRLKLSAPPGPVTLSWSTQNVEVASIVSTADETELPIPTEEIAQGSMQVHPDRSTTYVLRAQSHGRVREARVEVEVRRVWIDEFSASSTRIPLGGSLQLSWIGSDAGEVNLLGAGLQSQGFVESGSAFDDISGVGTLIQSAISGGANSLVNFPAGFSFPFFGATYTSLRVHGTGMISFNPAFSSWRYQPSAFPNPSEPEIHIAALWGDMAGNALEGQGVYGHFVEGPEPHFILQWSHFKPFGSELFGDLNFQVALFATGEVEFRYGAMSSSNNLAMGGLAAIGLQAPGGLEGDLLHYGPTDSVTFPGGLANRAWRWLPPGPFAHAASEQVKPPTSTTYTLCFDDGLYEECETVDVTVIAPGDLLITEAMSKPTANAPHWLEIRNLLDVPIDLQGFDISNGTTTVEVPASLPIPAGGHVVVADDHAPSLAPDLILPELPMGVGTNLLSLELDGVEISSFELQLATEGSSLQLPGDRQIRGRAHAVSGDLCTSTTSYDGMNRGSPGELSDCPLHGYVVDYYAATPFIDIRSTGTLVPELRTDSAVYAIPGGIGFYMPFFSTAVSELWVNSNGLIGFGGEPTSSSLNRDLLTSEEETEGIVAAFWDDLREADFAARSAFHHERRVVDGRAVTILQWSRFKRANHAGEITFQTQLWDDGDIVIAFENIEGNAIYLGADATVGIEAVSGSPAIQFLYNQAALRPHQSLLFRKR